MLPQYKLVLINGILSLLLLIGLLIYRYIFPKKKINLLYLLILISILPIISIFRVGTYESGDLSLHTTRLISFYNLFINYHLIPRWTPEFNAGFGDPHFLFAYFLPYFIGSIFHFIGLSFLTSIKFLLAFSFILSGITMYLWVKEELDERAGFIAAIFFLFTPYHLIDMHFRVTIAENLSFVFLPLALLATKRIIEKNNKKWFFFLSASIALLILSHQAISLMFFPILLSYSIFILLRKKKKIKNLLYFSTSILSGFLLSSFYWLPIIFLAKFTQQGANPTPISFPQLTDLLYSPWRFGLLFQGHKGELSYLIGYTQLFILIFSIYLAIKNKLDKKYKGLLTFFLLTSVIIFLMITPLSKPMWDITPFLRYSQFSTRLLVPLSLCISILAGIVTRKINKNWFFAMICFFTIFYTILNWGNRRTIPEITDNSLKREFNLKPDVSGLEPTSPIWADLNKSKLRIKSKSNIEILNGDATIKEVSRNPIFHSYKINAKSDIEIKENTLFFPGWIVIANNNFIPVNYKNRYSPGVVTFRLTKGEYNVGVKFVDLPIIYFSKLLSLTSLAIFILYLLIPKKLRFNFPKL